MTRLLVPESPPPTIWDWAVTTEVMTNRFVVIEYRDGRRIGGAHGRPGVSISSPEAHGIYLAIEWTSDGRGPITPVDGTAGVIVPITEDVRCIHLYEGDQGDHIVKAETKKVATPGEEKGLKTHKEEPPKRPTSKPASEPKQKS